MMRCQWPFGLLTISMTVYQGFIPRTNKSSYRQEQVCEPLSSAMEIEGLGKALECVEIGHDPMETAEVSPGHTLLCT
jgi:hypothetical protein